jgi:hypothetical protein
MNYFSMGHLLYDDDSVNFNRLIQGLLQNLFSICIYVKHTGPAVGRHELKEIRMVNVMIFVIGVSLIWAHNNLILPPM